jgi:hypothetical protein
LTDLHEFYAILRQSLGKFLSIDNIFQRYK